MLCLFTSSEMGTLSLPLIIREHKLTLFGDYGLLANFQSRLVGAQFSINPQPFNSHINGGTL